MPHCMVPQCSNGWRKTKGTDITYHRLPSGSMKSTWLRNIKRDNPRKPEHSFVCSVHFEPECFEPATEISGRKKQKNFKIVSSTNAVCVYKSEKRHNSPIKSKADQSA